MPNAKKELPRETGVNLAPPDESYAYFENSENHPFRHRAESFQLVNAWWLADAAFLAYTKPKFASRRLEQTRLGGFEAFSGRSTQCFVAHNDDFVITSFRGTEIKSLNSLQDILADLDFRLVRSGHGGRVHRGFKRALDEIWEKGGNLKAHLIELREKRPQRTFWFTGHSLGAALATLAADRFGDARGLYTYGSPRVGDEGFRDRFEINTYRFVHNNDIVCRVPPTSRLLALLGGPRHVGALKLIDRDGKILDNPILRNTINESFRESLAHVFDFVGNLRTSRLGDIPIGSLTDHAPIFYSIHVWNNLVEDAGSPS